MTLSFKAIAAALLVSLAPAVVSAQSFGIGHTGPGSWNSGPVYPSLGVGPPIGAPVQAHDCGAAHAQILVGRNINNTPLPGGVRVIGPDTIVTFDYRTDRLNVAHDGYGTITRVYCG